MSWNIVGWIIYSTNSFFDNTLTILYLQNYHNITIEYITNFIKVSIPTESMRTLFFIYHSKNNLIQIFWYFITNMVCLHSNCKKWVGWIWFSGEELSVICYLLSVICYLLSVMGSFKLRRKIPKLNYFVLHNCIFNKV